MSNHLTLSIKNRLMYINLLNISRKTGIGESQIRNTLDLLDTGASVPFIARYRKEITGALDEVQIATIRDSIESARSLEKRRAFVLKTIEELGQLNGQLKKKIDQANELSTLEDLYLPFKPKRRTKALIAKEKGLEPLADLILRGSSFNTKSFLYSNKKVNSESDALQGARDIIAERMNEDAIVRNKLRKLFSKSAVVSTKVISGKKDIAEKYKDYFDWSEPLKKSPSHRILAMRRAEKEGLLSMTIAPDAADALEILNNQFKVRSKINQEQIELATRDAYKRLIKPSLETEFRVLSKTRADEEAIKVFVDNLGGLLLASPLGQKKILALDPGFKSGCKMVVLGSQGELLENEVIYPNPPQNQQQKSEKIVLSAVKKYGVEAIAIGNGTASRETEDFVNGLGLDISTIMVNESGASIYSASEVAREEFPDYDVTVRGAVSIGRRLADPLAELVKIDPKSIGVGQYQHDVDQSLLKKSLDDVVSHCVNQVGVELNTASKQLLTFVSGLGPQLAQNIVDYRVQNGVFKSRNELKKVKRMGDKAYEQAAGFLRIRNAKNPLDTSGVHPESYMVVEQMAKDQKCSVKELIQDENKRKLIEIDQYVSNKIGLPTLKDIVGELEKPGRDPRKTFEVFSFAEGVNDISDLREGMRVPGLVTNVTKFGAFVDVGVHQDGLVHISELSDSFVSDPNSVVKIQEQVWVVVKEVDVQRRRISFSMKTGEVKVINKAKKVKKEGREEDFNSKMKSLKGKWKT